MGKQRVQWSRDVKTSYIFKNKELFVSHLYEMTIKAILQSSVVNKDEIVNEINKAKDTEFVKSVTDIMSKKEFIKSDIFDELISDQNIDLKDLAKAMFTIINGKQEQNNTSKNSYEPDENGYVRLFFSLGKKDKIMVKDIILNYNT